MKLAIVNHRHVACCLCEWQADGAEEWEILEHLQKKHARLLISYEETTYGKVYHGTRKCPFLDWTR